MFKYLFLLLTFALASSSVTGFGRELFYFVFQSPFTEVFRCLML